MRRITFHLAVALVAFVSGTFIAFQSRQTVPPLPQMNPIVDQHSIENKNVSVGFGSATGNRLSDSENETEYLDEIKKKPVICRDKKILLIWKQLIKGEKDFWENVNWTMKVYDCAQMFEAKYIDLNNDGIKEIKIRGKFGNFCGATGNCSEWVFGRTGKSGKYKLLLDSGGEYFHIKKRLTNGYHDIYITTHDSASSSYHMIYKFSGKRYKESKCWFEEYSVNGERQVRSCAEETKLVEQQLRESEARLKGNN
jgi:hypothetical protein